MGKQEEGRDCENQRQRTEASKRVVRWQVTLLGYGEVTGVGGS